MYYPIRKPKEIARDDVRCRRRYRNAGIKIFGKRFRLDLRVWKFVNGKMGLNALQKRTGKDM